MGIQHASTFGPARGWLAGLAILAGRAAAPARAAFEDPPPDPSGDPAAGPAARAYDSLVVEAVRAVLDPATCEQRPEVKRLAAALAGLGPPAIPVVVGLLCGEIEDLGVPRGGPEGRFQRELLEVRTEALRSSLKRFPIGQVVAYLSSRIEPTSGIDERLFVAEMLSDLDDECVFDALLKTLSGVEPIQFERTYVCGTLERALTAQLSSRPSNFGPLESFARGCDPAALPVLARGVADTRCTRGLEVLVRWLGRDARLDAIILRKLGQVLERSELAVPDSTLAEIRRLLASPDNAVRCAAVAVLGRLRDTESFAALVALLESNHALLASTARWSLRQLIEADLGAESAPWIAWQEEEARWWSETAPAMLEDLGGADPGRAFQAVTDLVQHPFYRHELTDDLAALLARPEPGLPQAACSALVRLGSSRAVPWLVDALDSADEPTREQIAKGLRTLTGLDLPPEPSAWMVALNP